MRFALSELLRWARSPAHVQRWAGRERSLEQAVDEVEDPMTHLERAPDAEHAVWLAAVLTVPLDLLAAAAAVTIESEASELDEPLALEACEHAVQALAGTDDPAALLAVAERCDARRAQEPVGYRGTDRRVDRVLTAAGALCRATEALAAARLRIAFERNASTQARVSILGAASIVGVGANAVLGDREPPFALARPALGDAAVPHDVRAAVGLLGDALRALESEDAHRVRNAFLDALASD